MESFGMKKVMEDLFYKYKVNLAFSGHVHAYERFAPIYNNVTTVDGTVYMTVGTGGQSYGMHFLHLLCRLNSMHLPWTAYACLRF